MPRDDHDLDPARWGLDVLDDLADLEHDLARRAVDTLYAAPPADDRLAALRRHAVALIVAAAEAQRRGGIGEDGLDDALLESADAIARLIDAGAG